MVRDWSGSAYLLTSLHRPHRHRRDDREIWSAAERLGGRICDPLDEGYLATLANGASSTPHDGQATATSLPVNIITGFLGSGKTTLLQRLLRSPDLRDVPVLVNEFGEIGLDHHLLQGVAESTLLLENGCLCCAVRGDLQRALRELVVPANARRGAVFSPRGHRDFRIGRSGADRLHAVVGGHPSSPFPFSGIVTTVDAVNGAAQIGGFPRRSNK